MCYRTISFSSAISTANSANSSRNKDWAGGSCWAGKRGVELQERRKDTFQDRFLSFTFSTQLGSLLIASFWQAPLQQHSSAGQPWQGQTGRRARRQRNLQGGKRQIWQCVHVEGVLLTRCMGVAPCTWQVQLCCCTVVSRCHAMDAKRISWPG